MGSCKVAECRSSTPFKCSTQLFGKDYCSRDEISCDEKIRKEWTLFFDVLSNLFPGSIAKAGLKKAIKASTKAAMKRQLKLYAKNVAKKKLKELAKDIKNDLKKLLKDTIKEELDSEVDRLLEVALEANELEALKETDRNVIANEFGSDAADVFFENMEELVLDILDPLNIRAFAEEFKEVPCEKVYSALKEITIEYEEDTFETDKTYKYTLIKTFDEARTYGQVVFQVKASNDAHIALGETTTVNIDSPTNYEIVLGGWRNTKSVIRNMPQTRDRVIEYPSVGVLNKDEYVKFRILWDKDFLRVGKDEFNSWKLLMEVEDRDTFGFRKIRYMSISTGFGSEGSWKIDPSSNEDGRNVSTEL